MKKKLPTTEPAIHLAFQDRVSRTICGFTDYNELWKFVRELPEEVFNRLPTVNPLKYPIPFFITAEDAFKFFHTGRWRGRERIM